MSAEQARDLEIELAPLDDVFARADFLTVVSFLVLVSVTQGTRIERPEHRPKAFFAMFRMTIYTAYTRIRVRFSYRSHKGAGHVTRRALCFHPGSQ